MITEDDRFPRNILHTFGLNADYQSRAKKTISVEKPQPFIRPQPQLMIIDHWFGLMK